MEGVQANPDSVLLRLLDHCPRFAFPAPWAFLSSDNLCRGSLTDPAKSLQCLLGDYSLDKLQAANIVERTNYEGWRLRPELCNPVGGLIGLRGNLTHPIECVMTPRGSLPQRLDPWTLAAKDPTIQEAIGEMKLLLVTFSLRDAMLLRALEIPAVIGLGLQHLGLSFFSAMNELIGSEDYVPKLPPEKEPAAAAEKGAAASATNTAGAATTAPETGGEPSPAPDANNIGLVLVGWSPYRLSLPYQTQLQMVANQVSRFRRFMGMKLTAISVWQVSSNVIENLKFRLKLQDPETITDLLCDTLHDLRDLEHFAASDVSLSEQSDAALPDFLAAQANLINVLTRVDPRKRSGVFPDAVSRAKAAYRACLEQELTRPLREAAMAEPDPVVRATGVNLATSCCLIQEMGPHMHV